MLRSENMNDVKYGVNVEGTFWERDLIDINAKGFLKPMKGRVGTYDQYVMKEIDRSYGMLKVEGKVVLDIGANIGCFSCWAMDHGADHVISIEPEPNNFNLLSKNINDRDSECGVTMYNAALTGQRDVEKTSLFLAPSGKNPGNSSTTSRKGRTEIKVRNLAVPNFFYANPGVEVAKIDCEGAEYDILPDLLQYGFLKQIALEFHISGFGIRKLEIAHEMLLDDGFEAVIPPKIQENLWQTLAYYVKG
jgi:FkbM family methyltransferase